MPPATDQVVTTTKPTSAVLPEGSPHRNRRASLKVLNRNIRQVVLGNIQFDAWYYSPYPDAIIHRPSTANGSTTSSEPRNGQGVHHGPVKVEESVCSLLYVCPCCFRYTALQHQFTQHLAHHCHLRAQCLESNHPIPKSALEVYDWEGYAVWEIDGEREKLYCQNLSLFGKLFLEQKSVFFDTDGFKYYVLTYTRPEGVLAAPSKTRGRRHRSSSGPAVEDDNPLYKTRVLGFFSKESLSWDANNLACILIFPPFQHRQLGQLLMAVSYKLSGWEWEGGIIGGPEKPLSAMGRKSYLRFWSERLARFMMGQTADADSKTVFDSNSGRQRKTIQPRKEEMTVTEIGDRTGMLGEDVVAALMDMGICRMVSPKRKKTKTSASETNGATAATHVRPAEADSEGLATMSIQRTWVVEWADNNGVDLISPVKEEGFLGEWALSDLAESEKSGNVSHE